MAFKTVDAKTLQAWINSGDAVVVDVREPGENNAESIPGAKLVPLATVTKSALPECKNKKLVIHCRSGGRSSAACQKLLSEDQGLEVYNLEGGITAWKDAGGALKESGKFFLPLDRQVQLTVGLCVLTGSLLGYYISPSFFVFTGLFGSGLTFAGLTGYCGLAMLLAKMPWNQNVTASKNFCMTKKS